MGGIEGKGRGGGGRGSYAPDWAQFPIARELSGEQLMKQHLPHALCKEMVLS